MICAENVTCVCVSVIVCVIQTHINCMLLAMMCVDEVYINVRVCVCVCVSEHDGVYMYSICENLLCSLESHLKVGLAVVRV